MTEKIPFSEARSEGAVTIRVVQGRVPLAREHAQLSQIMRLCTVMKGCWALNPMERPTVAECLKEVKWVVSRESVVTAKMPDGSYLLAIQRPIRRDAFRPQGPIRSPNA